MYERPVCFTMLRNYFGSQFGVFDSYARLQKCRKRQALTDGSVAGPERAQVLLGERPEPRHPEEESGGEFGESGQTAQRRPGEVVRNGYHPGQPDYLDDLRVLNTFGCALHTSKSSASGEPSHLRSLENLKIPSILDILYIQSNHQQMESQDTSITLRTDSERTGTVKPGL